MSDVETLHTRGDCSVYNFFFGLGKGQMLWMGLGEQRLQFSVFFLSIKFKEPSVDMLSLDGVSVVRSL